MTQINAYIGFNGQCREAMNFYKECLGGELNLMPIAGSPLAAQCPEAMQDGVAHAMLTNGGLVLMGTDMTGPAGYIKGTNIALSVNCSSEEEINSFYNKLSEGGQIVDTLKEQFWGALFGVVVDKFGITWMFNYDKKQNA